MTGLVMMVIVLCFDITFLAQFISMSTLVGYCLIMSIVIYKKMARKQASAYLQLVLFLLSMTLGFVHSMQIPGSHYWMLALGACIVTNVASIMLE